MIVITGAMAAGKSTVAALLAERFPRSVHLRGDSFRRMIVNGREEMSLRPSPEAQRQQQLRYELSVRTADAFAAQGFTAIVQDIIIGRELATYVARIETPDRFLVVLSPSVSVLEWREQQRKKAASMHVSVGAMDTVLRTETERIGYWLDSSAQSPDETVDDILAHLEQARV